MFVRESESYESNAPEIKQQAADIIGDETNAAIVAETLCQWVYGKLEKLTNGAGLTARETLEACSGDCSEHTSLFIALARAVGLPARGMTGLMFAGNEFVRHAWAEVWIGRWIPIDPAWGRVGTEAGYLSLGPDQDEDGVSRGRAVDMALFGDVSIRVLGVDLDGQVFHSAVEDDVWEIPDDPGVVVEHVRLRTGFTFAGRQIGFQDRQLVFQTPYGRTSVARTDIAQIRYVRGLSRRYENPEHGLTLDLPNKDWLFMDPQQAEFMCQFKTKDGNAMGLLRAEAFGGDLSAYVTVVQRVIKGVVAETSHVEMVQVGVGNERVPAARWSFVAKSDGGPSLAYEMLMVMHGGRAYRLPTWTTAESIEQRRPQLRALLESLHFAK